MGMHYSRRCVACPNFGRNSVVNSINPTECLSHNELSRLRQCGNHRQQTTSILGVALYLPLLPTSNDCCMCSPACRGVVRKAWWARSRVERVKKYVSELVCTDVDSTRSPFKYFPWPG